MRRTGLFALIFVLCILTVPGQLQIYVRSTNLWDTSLERNCESILLLFKDGTLIVATCYTENFVAIPWDMAFSRGRTPADMLVVIHNHLTLDRWSKMDDKTNHMFRDRGFAGPILLRLGNGETIEWTK
jgi:hypothetical protein